MDCGNCISLSSDEVMCVGPAFLGIREGIYPSSTERRIFFIFTRDHGGRVLDSH